MKKPAMIFLVTAAFLGLLHASHYEVTRSREWSEVLKLKPGGDPPVIEVDNIFGPVRVTGHSDSRVMLQARETIKAENQTRLEKAREETRLAIRSTEGRLRIYAHGPFRQKDGKVNWCRDLGYTVQYDLELKVPPHSRVDVKTVNRGDIQLSDLQGAFSAQNVNGPIRLEQITGSGRAVTVNGTLTVIFKKNPRENCRFSTINGDIALFFNPPLSADFWLQTLHGKMLSDFPFRYLPREKTSGSREKGRYVYRSHGSQGIRIGSDGPCIRVKTLNGSITINKNKTQ